MYRLLKRALCRKFFVPRAAFISGFATKNSTVDNEEVARFSKLANQWWDESGSLKALHSMNKLRVPWIRNTLANRDVQNSKDSMNCRPLIGQKLLDIGCGGGLLSEPLARLGANVTGIDAAKDCIEIARFHALKDQNLAEKLTYLPISVEEFKFEPEEDKFDAIVASEILEHVDNRQAFIEHSVRLLKPGGVIFITTLNKTWVANVLGILVAEKILKIVPDGTHAWEKFTPPDDLRFLLERTGCSTKLVHGLCYNPLTNRWSWSGSTSINYAVHAFKGREE